MNHQGAARLLRFFPSRGLRVSRASGQYVWDDGGRRYLDLHCGNGAAFLGHLNPRVVERIEEQLGSLMVSPPIFETDVLERCLDLLGKILPSRLLNVYFMNSGSEAVELALKLARKRTGRRRFAAFTGSFHGRTMGALGLTHNQRYRAGYDPFPWDSVFLPFNDASALERLDESFAAVVVEPVQGEGGLAVASREFMKAIEEACRRTGSLMIVDEVQSGFGRTGTLWAHTTHGVEPDIMVAGKSIGGGFPVSLVAVSDEVASRVEEGEHGSTHGGNPIALAALTGGIEAQIGDNVAARAAEIGGLFSSRLRELASSHSDLVRGVKGRGLMLGLDMRFNPTPLLRALQDRGLLALKAGATVLRMLPPYLISEEDVSLSIRVLEEVISESPGRRLDTVNRT